MLVELKLQLLLLLLLSVLSVGRRRSGRCDELAQLEMEVVESRVKLDADVQDGEACAACVVAHGQLFVELEAGGLEDLAQTQLAGADEIVRHRRDASVACEHLEENGGAPPRLEQIRVEQVDAEVRLVIVDDHVPLLLLLLRRTIRSVS